MRKIIRILLLLSPLIIVGLTFYEQTRWVSPIFPEKTQYIGVGTLLDHPEVYQAPMTLIVHGIVHNKSGSGDFLFFYLDKEWIFFNVNCSQLDISELEGGMTVYLRGKSYYHEPSKQYFLAEDFHILVSYSLYLSIPGAFLVLLILFLWFKFKFQDFSFSRKDTEEGDCQTG